MNLKNNIKKILLCISLLCITLFSTVSICSCGAVDSLLYVAQSREEYLENIDSLRAEDDLGYTYVSQYLRKLGTPVFDIDKVIYFEEVFRQYYNLSPGLPDTAEHAILAAEYFAEHFLDGIDRDDKVKVTDAVISSYVDVIGDIYSVYRPKEEFEDHLSNMSGSFGGIGVTIEFDHTNKTATIIEVSIGSPAERAGIAVGDLIIGVDGKTTEEMGYQNIAYYTRGDIGTEVLVTVRRGSRALDFTIVREKIEAKTVEYAIDENKIGYIRIASFKENTYFQFVEAVDFIKEMGAAGVIFDLRNNPGGYVDSVIDVLSYILPSGREVVSYDYKNGKHVSKKTEDDKHPVTDAVADHTLDIPMAVVCNEYSASSAEIFIAAIRDYRDFDLISAVTVGNITYKKGIMQASFDYKPDGSSVTLTIAYYAPPSGVCYHGVGITPDYTVENTETEDRQLSCAYELLLDLINK